MSPHPPQHLLLSCCCFFFNSHPNGCEVVFYFALIVISLMTNDADTFSCAYCR